MQMGATFVQRHKAVEAGHLDEVQDVRCSTAILARGPLARPRCIPQAVAHPRHRACCTIETPAVSSRLWKGVPAPPQDPTQTNVVAAGPATDGVCRPGPCTDAVRAWRRPREPSALPEPHRQRTNLHSSNTPPIADADLKSTSLQAEPRQYPVWSICRFPLYSRSVSCVLAIAAGHRTVIQSNSNA